MMHITFHNEVECSTPTTMLLERSTMSDNTFDPFDVALTKAKADKAAKEEAAAAALAAEQAAAKALREEAAKQARAEKFQNFPNDFRQRVVRYIFCNKSYDANPVFMELTISYANALLSNDDVELPNLAQNWAERVLTQFNWTLESAGDAIPDGHFYGQRILAAREEQKQDSKSSDRIRIEPPKLRLDEDTTVSETSDERSGEVLDLGAARERLVRSAGPAVTPPVKGKDKRPAAVRTSKKASVSPRRPASADQQHVGCTPAQITHRRVAEPGNIPRLLSKTREGLFC
jgi:hypothetical protein